jgi:hypothetical protein
VTRKLGAQIQSPESGQTQQSKNALEEIATASGNPAQIVHENSNEIARSCGSLALCTNAAHASLMNAASKAGRRRENDRPHGDGTRGITRGLATACRNSESRRGVDAYCPFDLK